MKKRKRRSDAEWQQLIEQQQSSGLSASTFCQRQGLSSKTFYKRRQALQQQMPAAPSTKRFIKLEPKSTPEAATPTTVILQHHDTRLHLPADVDTCWLAQLMQALS